MANNFIETDPQYGTLKVHKRPIVGAVGVLALAEHALARTGCPAIACFALRHLTRSVTKPICTSARPVADRIDNTSAGGVSSSSD